MLAATLAGLGFITSGCGDSGGPAVADLGTTTVAPPTPSVSASSGTAAGSGAQAAGGKEGVPFSLEGSVPQMAKFAACMRANGEPKFPNPNAQGVVSAGSLDRGSPQFEHALQACRKDLPGGIPTPAQQKTDLLRAVAFSACMRHNGVPNYPDPKGGTIQLLNVDQSSPQFQRAQAACQQEFPGTGKG